ncbi:MAG: hypothetical protein WCE62_15200, partial [Polyangiales bacterium]
MIPSTLGFNSARERILLPVVGVRQVVRGSRSIGVTRREDRLTRGFAIEPDSYSITLPRSATAVVKLSV